MPKIRLLLLLFFVQLLSCSVSKPLGEENVSGRRFDDLHRFLQIVPGVTRAQVLERRPQLNDARRSTFAENDVGPEADILNAEILVGESNSFPRMEVTEYYKFGGWRDRLVASEAMLTTSDATYAGEIFEAVLDQISVFEKQYRKVSVFRTPSPSKSRNECPEVVVGDGVTTQVVRLLRVFPESIGSKEQTCIQILQYHSSDWAVLSESRAPSEAVTLLPGNVFRKFGLEKVFRALSAESDNSAS